MTPRGAHRGPSARTPRNPWRRLTHRGRFFLVAGLLGTALSLWWGQRDLAFVGLLMTLLPLGTLAVLHRSARDLDVAREVVPMRVPLGARLGVHLTLRKRGLLPDGLLQFQDAVPPQLGRRARFTAQRVAGSWQRDLSYPLRGLARGRHRVGPLWVRTADPFGMVAFTRAVGGASEVLVTPPLHPLPALLDAGGVATSGESAPEHVGRVGQDDVLVREYQQGDDVRRVHWRSTARWNQLMVRREEQAWEPAVTVLLDTRASARPRRGPATDQRPDAARRPAPSTGPGGSGSSGSGSSGSGSSGSGSSGSSGQPGATDVAFEWCVSAAASICEHFSASGYRVRLVGCDGELVRTTGNDTAATREACLTALTEVAPSASTSMAGAVAACQRGRDGGIVVAVLRRPRTDDIPALVHIRRAHSQGFAMVLDAGDPQGLPAAAAAEQLVQQRWRVAAVEAGTSVPAAWHALAGAVRA